MESETQIFDKSAVEREKFTDYLLEETVLDAIRVFEERSGHIVNKVKLKRHNDKWNVHLGLNSDQGATRANLTSDALDKYLHSLSSNDKETSK